MTNTINNGSEDAELAILENLYSVPKDAPPPRQRDLAAAAGASLGMTNAILKRLAQKGMIVVRRLNRRNISYAVTPDGVNEIARRSYRYFKRTIRNIVFYRERIDEAVAHAKASGFQTVLMVGVSDLDFIVEHSCVRHGLSFMRSVDAELVPNAVRSGVFVVVAENLPPGAELGGVGLRLATILNGTELAHA